MFKLTSPTKIGFLILSIIALVVWQLSLALNSKKLDTTYQLRSKSMPQLPSPRGYYAAQYREFFSFFYHTGHFPIASTNPRLYRNPKEIKQSIQPGSGQHLVMEKYIAYRSGDHGPLLLLFPSVWFGHPTWNPTLVTFNRIFGITSLLMLYLSFCYCRRPYFGALLVTVLGSNPTFLFELYQNNNVLGHSLAYSVFLLAIFLPFVLQKQISGRLTWIAVIVGASSLAFMRQIRTESLLMCLPILALICSYRWHSRVERLARVCTFLAVYLIGASLWTGYWNHKFERASQVVSAAGGIPYDGVRQQHHRIWHSIWCGLGDFGGNSRPFRWLDIEGFKFGIPLVNQRYGTNYELHDSLWLLKNKYQKQNHYHIRPEDLTEYMSVLKERVIAEILTDPMWYARVLSKRVRRVFDEPSPVRLSWEGGWAQIPFSAWLILPLLVLLFFRKQWSELKLTLFFLPLSVTPIAIYSGVGLTYLSLFHYVGFVVGMSLLSEWAAGRLTQFRKSMDFKGLKDESNAN